LHKTFERSLTFPYFKHDVDWNPSFCVDAQARNPGIFLDLLGVETDDLSTRSAIGGSRGQRHTIGSKLPTSLFFGQLEGALQGDFSD
jgi:hypothetical protein